MHLDFSLRFDFFGCGESSPHFLADLTVNGMLQDAKAALCYLEQTITAQNISIGLCGFSLGAAITGLLMQDKCFPSVVGLSPVINLMNDLAYQHQNLIDDMLNKPLNDNEPIEYDLGWRKIPIRPEFIRQFAHFDPLIAANWQKYAGACLVIGGELDFSGENVKRFNQTAPNVRILRQEFLRQTDHVFNIFTGSDNHAPWVIETVTNWFIKTL